MRLDPCYALIRMGNRGVLNLRGQGQACKPFCGICPVLAFAASGKFEIDPSEDSKCRTNIFLFAYLFEKLVREPEDIKLVLKMKRIHRALSDAVMEDGLHD